MISMKPFRIPPILLPAIAALFFAGNHAADAHAVFAHVESPSTAVRFTYDDGTPVADAEAEVFAPDQSTAFWTGTTDPNGRIAFVPDRPGAWTVSADDGMGHAATIRIRVDETGVAIVTPERRLSRLSGLLAGVGVIFGLFGLAAYRASRQARPS